MENVLSAIVVVFVIMFAVLTLSQAFVEAQDELGTTLMEMDARLDENAQALLLPVDAWLTEDKSVAALVFRNSGAARLTDFDRWDLMVEYYDSQETPGLHIAWLPYSAAVPFDGEWTVGGLYLNAAEARAEAIEPGILNPGEEILLLARLSPQIGIGRTLQVSLATGSGTTASLQYTRNMPPVLAVNTGLTLPSGAQVTIERTLLETTDEDGPAADLVYTVSVPPAQGLLSPESTFTQAEINAGRVSYTHTGSGNDSFIFSVSDGEDTIADVIFAVTVTNAAPVLATNTGASVPVGQMEIIGSSALQTTDADDAPASLIYTITIPPSFGLLSLGGTFTQQDIENGLLNYTHTGAGSDSFAFTVTDGKVSIGPFAFGITTP